ncbi:hypothetical protein ACIBF1_21090 [Spirillospora sp. NPDC050679]
MGTERIDPETIVSAEDLAAALRALFDQQSLGIQRFAAQAGLSSDTVFKLINGMVREPRAGTIQAFAAGCGEDPAPWLLARRRVIAARRTFRGGRPVGGRAAPERREVTGRTALKNRHIPIAYNSPAD